MWRIVVTVACNFLLWLIVAQANHYLALWHCSLFLGGVMVSFSALRLPYADGARIAFLTGLFLDACAPVPFGLHGFLFLLTHGVIVSIRARLPREENVVSLFVASLANVGIFLALSVAFLMRGRLPVSVWPRLLADAVASQVVIVGITPWFFALNDRALEICGVGLRRAQRGLH